MPKTLVRASSRMTASTVMIGVRPSEHEFIKKTQHKFRKLQDSRLATANSADEVVEALQIMLNRYKSCLLSRKDAKTTIKIMNYLNKHCPKY